jgi:peptidyl-prolyl cis-trans isomerase A (cyclophilin A)
MRKLLFLTAAIAGFSALGLTQTHRQKEATPIGKTAKLKEPDVPAVALPTEPGLYAIIYTSMGNIVCRLFEKEAPKTVANFRGLATGTKAWTDPKTGRVRHNPLYPGTTFHRVIPDFMIQGGDPAGDGTGSPGYKFDNETDPNLKFDRPGMLAMANSGPNTNGCQFFITVAPAEHLNGDYSIFGEVVSGQEVADAISKVPRNAEDKPDTPVAIKAIVIRRVEPSGAAKSGNQD